MKSSEILLKAAKLIDTPEKWRKGLLKDIDGRMCALGACMKAAGCDGNKYYNRCYGNVISHLDINGDLSEMIADFNDAKDTTHGDVMQLFATAIVLAKDQGD